MANPDAIIEAFVLQLVRDGDIPAPNLVVLPAEAALLQRLVQQWARDSAGAPPTTPADVVRGLAAAFRTTIYPDIVRTAATGGAVIMLIAMLLYHCSQCKEEKKEEDPCAPSYNLQSIGRRVAPRKKKNRGGVAAIDPWKR